MRIECGFGEFVDYNSIKNPWADFIRGRGLMAAGKNELGNKLKEVY